MSEKVSRSGVLWFIESTLGLDPSEVVSVNIEHGGIEVEFIDRSAPTDCDIHTYRKMFTYADTMNIPWRYDA